MQKPLFANNVRVCGRPTTSALRLLTSNDFVGIFVGSNLTPRARYQHAANGCEVPKCEGKNQSI